MGGLGRFRGLNSTKQLPGSGPLFASLPLRLRRVLVAAGRSRSAVDREVQHVVLRHQLRVLQPGDVR